MLSQECVRELQTNWLPNITDDGLDRLIDLLEKGSPLLIHGSFSRAFPMGCLATHIAWNHPSTANLVVDAGICWLNRVAGLNPVNSHVIREWDQAMSHTIFRGTPEQAAEAVAAALAEEFQPADVSENNWEIRTDLLKELKENRAARHEQKPVSKPRFRAADLAAK